MRIDTLHPRVILFLENFTLEKKRVHIHTHTHMMVCAG